MGSASDWYWVAADVRIYSSARQQVVDAGDAGYVAFCRRARPTAWPRDAAGEQTTAALQEVLAPYGLWIDLLAYAADVRWRRETGGIVFAGIAVATDDRSKTMILGARLAAIADPEWSTVWRAADGATVWQAGPYAYAQIPYLTTVGGEAEALFGFDGKKFTTPVAGEYFIQVRGQFNADAATGGAGVAITAGAFTTIGNAMNYAYADIAAGFSVNMTANVTHCLPAGQRVDFNFALTNAASRIRAQDFGVNVIYLGR